jgi:hypothetical protein
VGVEEESISRRVVYCVDHAVKVLVACVSLQLCVSPSEEGVACLVLILVVNLPVGFLEVLLFTQDWICDRPLNVIFI